LMFDRRNALKIQCACFLLFKHLSVSIAMAGKIHKAINVYLELFVTFWLDAKK
jgi:hypothetical protein